MSAAVDTYAGPAYQGWRSWRIMPFQRLGEPDSIRLCACGTRGLPKVWEPRQAMRAVCGKFSTTHDAPWLDCECGFHGYREQWLAEDHLSTFVGGTNGDAALGWAFGRVSLWGRIVEHVDGWRAEYAYPYEVTVFGTPELASQVRSVYGIDVEIKGVDELPKRPPDDEEEPDDEPAMQSTPGEILDRAERLLDEISGKLAKPATPKPKYLRDVLLGKPEKITSALQTAAWAKDAPTAPTAKELAVATMTAVGATDYEPWLSDTVSLGADLYQLAMRRQVHRLTGPKGEARWMVCYASLPTGCTENDPTLEHLDRDLQMVAALYRTAGLKAGTAKAMVASLSEQIGKTQTSQSWSGSFVRLQLRGWTTSPEKRTYMLTDYGAAVAKRGDEIPAWPGCTNDDLILSELRAAVEEAGDFVDFYEVARRFRNGGNWHTNGHPRGPEVCQRLLKLQRAGLIETERRRSSTLLLYKPREGVTVDA